MFSWVYNVVYNAGDAMGSNDGKVFSTKDRDNDGNSGSSCAQSRQAGWWFLSCSVANLNGVYHHDGRSASELGVNWRYWLGDTYSLKSTELKIRPYLSRHSVRDTAGSRVSCDVILV